MDAAFTNNQDKKRYEFKMNGATATADYHRDGDTVYIDYVEAPLELRGTGAAGKLMSAIIEDADRQSLKVVPICGYAASWMRKNGR
jgi:predicted GNAT family acetyltransferase